jgi:F plasmid transfer operon protein
MAALPPQLEAGTFLPTVQVAGETGALVPLTALAVDGPALLFVYKSDCPATAVAGPVLGRFAQLTGLRIVAISQDVAFETAEFAVACGWAGKVEVLRDPEPWRASEALGARVTPTWILVGRGGRIAAAAEGWSRDDANQLAESAAALLDLAPVTVSREGGAEPPWRPG